MLVGSQDIMLGNAARLRGVIAAGVLNIKYEIAHIAHLLTASVMRDRDNSPNNTIKVGADGHPIQVIRAEHPKRTKLKPPTNHRETLGAEFT